MVEQEIRRPEQRVEAGFVDGDDRTGGRAAAEKR
jgi:hypothetical protein